jgi:hypothetical protein
MKDLIHFRQGKILNSVCFQRPSQGKGEVERTFLLSRLLLWITHVYYMQWHSFCLSSGMENINHKETIFLMEYTLHIKN